MDKANWFVARLSEPSTHAGLAAIMQGAKILAPQYSAVFDCFTLLFGGIAAVKKG
jgi:hypothetical protein